MFAIDIHTRLLADFSSKKTLSEHPRRQKTLGEAATVLITTWFFWNIIWNIFNLLPQISLSMERRMWCRYCLSPMSSLLPNNLLHSTRFSPFPMFNIYHPHSLNIHPYSRTFHVSKNHIISLQSAKIYFHSNLLSPHHQLFIKLGTHPDALRDARCEGDEGVVFPPNSLIFGIYWKKQFNLEVRLMYVLTTREDVRRRQKMSL